MFWIIMAIFVGALLVAPALAVVGARYRSH
jgi:hypothetical protein